MFFAGDKIKSVLSVCVLFFIFYFLIVQKNPIQSLWVNFKRKQFESTLFLEPYRETFRNKNGLSGLCSIAIVKFAVSI
jgi:hypothetical protein